MNPRPVAVVVKLAQPGQEARIVSAASAAGLPCVEAAPDTLAGAAWWRETPAVLVTGAVPDAAHCAARSLPQSLEFIRQTRLASPYLPAIVFLGGQADWAAAYGSGADFCFAPDVAEDVLAAALTAVAERLRCYLKLKDALHYAEAMGAGVVDGLLTLDAQGVIKWANDAAMALFGRSREELLGCDVAALAGGTAREFYESFGSGALGGLEGGRRELLGRHKDGHEFPLEVSYSKVSRGGTAHYVAVLRDITLRKAEQKVLAEKAAHLERLQEHHRSENELAREVVDRLQQRYWQNDPMVRRHVSPAAGFSGDLVAAVRSPAGRLYALLADAAGHGLPAALSLLPMVSAFYAGARRSQPVAAIVGAINDELRSVMPSHRFIAATLVCLDPARRMGEAWLGGMPEMLLLDADGTVQRRFASGRLALGIEDNTPVYIQPEIFAWRGQGQLLVCSDGVIEAENCAGAPFGQERLWEALRGTDSAARIDGVLRALTAHLDGAPPGDDISLLCMDLQA